MKILFLSHKIPFPPNKGDRIPTYHRMEHLHREGHEISMVFPCFSKSDMVYIKDVKKFCKSVDTAYINPTFSKVASLFSFMTDKPLTLPYFYSKELHEMIKKRLAEEKFDVIYVYSSSMAQYVFDVKGIKKIMDLADSDSHKWMQYALHTKGPMKNVYRREGSCLQTYEQSICKEFDEVIAISNDEKSLFESYIKKTNFKVIPNGVDSDYYSASNQEYKRKQLMFVGAMDYFANVDCVVHFVHNILPLIRVRVPDVKFYIVGVNPTRAVRSLAHNRNVIVTGRVDDIRPYLKDSCACVVPLRIAQGIQNKILQAMAAGVPVVTTAKGNEGINAVSGDSICVSDDFQRFADQTVKLIEDPRVRMRISRRAREFVTECFQWEKNMNLFETIVSGKAKKDISGTFGVSEPQDIKT
jgi:sugar transferase (PEP-CTERM/EpsH1 system associated)